MKCQRCGLPMFDGGAGHAGPQCRCTSCWHGQLARSCERCDDAKEIHRLRAENERLRVELAGVEAQVLRAGGYLERLRAELESAKAKLLAAHLD